MNNLIIGAIVATSVAVAGVGTYAAIDAVSNELSATAAVAGPIPSSYYTPPTIKFIKQDKETAYPYKDTMYAKYPYYTVFLGAELAPYGSRSFRTVIVFSKKPLADFITFTYSPLPINDRNNLDTKDKYGQIFARVDWTNVSWGDTDYMVQWSNLGFLKDYEDITVDIGTWALQSHAGHPSLWREEDLKGFRFDYIYTCETNGEIAGARSIYDVPYDYLIHCPSHGGTNSGGGQTDPNSSSSSSSSSSGGSSSDGSSSSTSKYPWEDDNNVSKPTIDASTPDYINKGEDGEGEDGNTWELPTYEPQKPPIDSDNINIPLMPDATAPAFPTLPMPSAPDLPLLPMPSAPNLPTLPVPSAPNLPTLPVPSAPKLPSLPAPESPKLPTLPMPSAPGLPTLPAPSAPKLPDLPLLNFPSVPINPGYDPKDPWVWPPPFPGFG